MAESAFAALRAFGDSIRATYRESEVHQLRWQPKGGATGDLVLDLRGQHRFDQVALVTGLWGELIAWLRGPIAGFTTPL